MVKKIVAIGPESTGKSMLCQQLASHYNTLWVPEFAREYLEKNGTKYTYEDLLIIAKGQISLEEAYTVNKIQSLKSSIPNKSSYSSPFSTDNSMLFIDTDMYVMKVWCEFAFEKCHNWILNQIAARKYDLYLLCNIDLPWVKDNLREYPDLDTRARLYVYYKDIMINQNTPWVDVCGNYEQRFERAKQAVDSII